MIRYILIILVTFVLVSCNNSTEEQQEAIVDDHYVMQGKIIAQTSAGVLMGKLTTTLTNKGMAEAIKYCNTVGIPALDSISKVYNAAVKRTSLKIRNPKNAPDQLENEILHNWEMAMNQGKSPNIVTKVIDSNTTRFFAPIFVQSFCLKCHGEVNVDIEPHNVRIIDSLYPGDKARNFKAGDLRGMWSISLRH